MVMVDKRFKMREIASTVEIESEFVYSILLKNFYINTLSA